MALPTMQEPPVLKSPWWQSLLWRVFQLGIVIVVWLAIETWNDSQNIVAKESLAPLAIAVGTAWLLTVLLSWRPKKTARDLPKNVVNPGIHAEQAALTSEGWGALSGHQPGERSIGPEK